MDGGEDGCFVIIPESVDDSHPGYLMRADGKHPSELKVLAGGRVGTKRSRCMARSSGRIVFFGADRGDAAGRAPWIFRGQAADWVAGLNKARNEEIEKTSANGGGRKREAGGCCSMCFGRKSAEREPLTRAY